MKVYVLFSWARNWEAYLEENFIAVFKSKEEALNRTNFSPYSPAEQRPSKVITSDDFWQNREEYEESDIDQFYMIKEYTI